MDKVVLLTFFNPSIFNNIFEIYIGKFWVILKLYKKYIQTNVLSSKLFGIYNNQRKRVRGKPSIAGGVLGLKFLELESENILFIVTNAEVYVNLNNEKFKIKEKKKKEKKAD